MKKLISGMFSSVSDAELFLAAHAYDDDAPESVTEDKFADYDQDDLTRAEIESPNVSQATANQGLEDSFK